jgi:hypothetical protein
VIALLVAFDAIYWSLCGLLIAAGAAMRGFHSTELRAAVE